MKQIGIDIDVNRAIESARLSFNEEANDILRRMLGIDGRPPKRNGPRPRVSRSSGAYSTQLGKDPIEANSLKELLRRVLLKAEQMSPGTVVALASTPTVRGRYLVAKTPEGLYPKSPQLVEYADRLDDDWWYDTNVGRNQVLSYLKQIARHLRLTQLPTISKRAEKSTLTLEDLDL